MIGGSWDVRGFAPLLCVSYIMHYFCRTTTGNSLAFSISLDPDRCTISKVVNISLPRPEEMGIFSRRMAMLLGHALYTLVYSPSFSISVFCRLIFFMFFAIYCAGGVFAISKLFFE